jgi:hypothetical protein
MEIEAANLRSRDDRRVEEEERVNVEDQIDVFVPDPIG